MDENIELFNQHFDTHCLNKDKLEKKLATSLFLNNLMMFSILNNISRRYEFPVSTRNITAYIDEISNKSKVIKNINLPSVHKMEDNITFLLY